MAKFRRSLAGDGGPLLGWEIIAAACECPALTYELLVAAREAAAAERVEMAPAADRNEWPRSR